MTFLTVGANHLTTMSAATAQTPLLEGMSTSNQSVADSNQPVDDATVVLENIPDYAEIETKTSQRLYVSHFLSTWNSRLFEFGATLFLATIFPGTLLPLSIYALARSLSAIFLSPSIGRYIDNNNRIVVVRLSIGELQLEPFPVIFTQSSQSFRELQSPYRALFFCT